MHQPQCVKVCGLCLLIVLMGCLELVPAGAVDLSIPVEDWSELEGNWALVKVIRDTETQGGNVSGGTYFYDPRDTLLAMLKVSDTTVTRYARYRRGFQYYLNDSLHCFGVSLINKSKGRLYLDTIVFTSHYSLGSGSSFYCDHYVRTSLSIPTTLCKSRGPG